MKQYYSPSLHIVQINCSTILSGSGGGGGNSGSMNIGGNGQHQGGARAPQL